MSAVQKDAARVAREMHLLYIYIWIYALCIMQGDATDWETESSNRSHICRNSSLAACVLTSWNCQEGVLTRGSVPILRIPLNPDVVACGNATDDVYALRPAQAYESPNMDYETAIAWISGDFESSQPLEVL